MQVIRTTTSKCQCKDTVTCLQLLAKCLTIFIPYITCCKGALSLNGPTQHPSGHKIYSPITITISLELFSEPILTCLSVCLSFQTLSIYFCLQPAGHSLLFVVAVVSDVVRGAGNSFIRQD